jgi:hypothetical protein
VRPPYDPAHVEKILLPRLLDEQGRPEGTDQSCVIARCSCGWWGSNHRLGVNGVATLLAADLNAHRATYVDGAPLIEVDEP